MMGESGTIAFLDEGCDAAASAVAGALAEAGVQLLEVNDPRACRTWTLKARESDLPRALLEAEPGTTLSGAGVALLIDERQIRWVAEAPIATRLRAIKPQ
jgi:hypothetical protein